MQPDQPDSIVRDLPHLGSPAGQCRHVLAAHFARDCPHVLELGGHQLPLTGFLLHGPASVTSIDPKIEPLEADELHGRPCRVRHIARKFQSVPLALEPHSYALVILGYSLKAYGDARPDDALLFSLIDNAKRVIIDYAVNLPRAAEQMPRIVGRGTLRRICQIGLRLEDDANPQDHWLGERRFMVFEPMAENA